MKGLKRLCDDNNPNNGKSEENSTKTCLRCRRMFTHMENTYMVCSFCQEADRKDFELVRNYIREHVGTNIVEVSEATGVKRSYLTMYLREGRLEIPQGSPIFIHCELCGAEIRSGRICQQCAIGLGNAARNKMEFSSLNIGETPKKSQIGKMHYIGKDRNDRN